MSFIVNLSTGQPASVTAGNMLYDNGVADVVRPFSLNKEVFSGMGWQLRELQWSFDPAMSKAIRITESKSVQVRLDATNILNHPVPNSPSFDINSTNPFGFVPDKGTSGASSRDVRLNF